MWPQSLSFTVYALENHAEFIQNFILESNHLKVAFLLNIQEISKNHSPV